MIEDEEAVRQMQGDGETLLYDYFKHLTSLCLFSLGGVVALSDTRAKPELLIAALTVIGLSGVISFSGASDIVRARVTETPVSKSLNFNRYAAPALLSVGLGMFLYLFAGSL